MGYIDQKWQMEIGTRDRGIKMDFFQCTTLGKAQELIIGSLHKRKIPTERVELSASLGRIAAEYIFAQEDLPPFSRSTVDGFAVRSADTFGANESSPALFHIIGEVVMGEETLVELLPGQGVAIPTGGMLPRGADGIVMVEYTEKYDADTVMVLKMIAPGENVIAKGDDMQAENMIVPQGQKLAPQHIGALAACGWGSILVYQKVTVGIISTGDELVDIHEPVKFGQIRDVNSYALGAMLSEMGCIVKQMGIVKDNFQKFFEMLQQATATCQLVVISGGSSVGARDYTEKSIDALGSPGVLIHGITMKPGKPTIFGIADGVPIFGLPGHPVAAMMVCDQLVKLAAYKLMGKEKGVDEITIQAQLARNLASAAGRDDFITVKLRKQDGKYLADPILGKSGMISSMSEANGIIHISADKSGLYVGDLVEVRINKSMA